MLWVSVNYVFGRANALASRNRGSFDSVPRSESKSILRFQLRQNGSCLGKTFRANAANLRADRAERLNFGRGLHAL